MKFNFDEDKTLLYFQITAAIILIAIVIGFLNLLWTKYHPNTETADSFDNPQLERVKASQENKKNGPQLVEIQDPNNPDSQDDIKFENLNLTDDEKAFFNSSENYLKNALTSRGKLRRWSKSFIQIYPEHINTEILKIVTDNLNENQTVIHLEIAENPTNADIIISSSQFIQNQNYSSNPLKSLTKCKSISIDGYIESISNCTIQIQTINYETQEPFSNDDLTYLYSHEIGHALGICGHSNNKFDVMYPIKTADNSKGFSTRDIKTIEKLMNEVPSHLKSVTQNYKKYRIEQAEQITKLSNSSSASLLKLGKTYFEMGEKANALKAYKSALEKDSSNPFVYMAFADAYKASGKTNSAIKFYNLAKEKDGSNLITQRANNSIADIYNKNGYYQDAIKPLSENFERFPSNQAYAYNLSIMYKQINNKPMVKNTLDKFFSYSPMQKENEKFIKLYEWATTIPTPNQN